MVWPEKYADKPADHVDKSLNKRVSQIFTAESLKRGEDPSILLGRGNNVSTFRASYAEAFTDTVWSRLLRMRHARSQDTTSLVLADVKARVDEVFYEKFPYFRPVPAGTPGAAYVSPTENCERCQNAKSGYCREHNYLKPSNAAVKERPYSRAGWDRGERAAESVDLGGTAAQPRMSSQNDRNAVEGR
jgi:hypothetical protein